MQTGSIKQHGRWWVLKYREDVMKGGLKVRRDAYKKLAPIDHNHQPKSDGSAPDKVRALANMELAPVNAGLLQATSADSLKSFLETFLARGEGGRGRPLASVTVASYIRDYNVAKPFIPDIEVRQVRTPHIDEILQAISKDDGNDRRAQTAYNNIKNLFSTAFKYAVRKGLADFNPARDAAIPEGNDADTHAYTLEEFYGLMNATEGNHTMRTAFMVAAFTGLRMEELKGLRWDDYDREAGTLLVRRTVVRGVIRENTKTKASKALVPVVEIVKNALEEHLNRNSGDGYIFHAETDSQTPVIFENVIREYVIPATKKAKVKWHAMHAFRRGLASALHDLGTDPLTIKHIMRHSISAKDVTAKHYIKPSLKLMRAALEKVEAKYKAIEKKRR